MKFERHTPIGPWIRCVHEACVFDNYAEFCTARALDRTDSVVWWIRNDPALLTIPTPVGGFEPDFLYLRNRSGLLIKGALEVKGDFLWTSPEQPDRVKARGAREWVKKTNEVSPEEPWEVAVVGDQEAKACVHLGDLLVSAEGRLYEGPA